MEKKRILVVDDEENIRLLYKEEFEDEGFDVELVSSGEDALKRLEDDVIIDLVLLDIKMTGMSGIDVLKKIKGKQKDLPVILCSAYHHYKQDLGTWASEAYIVKSSDMAELKRTVKDILKG